MRQDHEHDAQHQQRRTERLQPEAHLAAPLHDSGVPVGQTGTWPSPPPIISPAPKRAAPPSSTSTFSLASASLGARPQIFGPQ